MKQTESRAHGGHLGRIGIIGGSGLGEALCAWMDDAGRREVEVETPFGAPSDTIMLGTWKSVPLAILRRHGAGHRFMPAAVPYRANIWALRSLGCTHLVASGATGSLREEIAPGDLVIADQLIDRTDGRPRTFFERGAVHVELADPVCPVMRQWLLDAGSTLESVRTHSRGTYVCIEGPSFSTRAEAQMHRAIGADVVGMTALPEARLAREACMAYALMALPTDYDCWRTRPHDDAAGSSLLQEIIANLERAVIASIALLVAALSDVTALQSAQSPAHRALDLAVWTPEKALDDHERELLRVFRAPV